MQADTPLAYYRHTSRKLLWLAAMLLVLVVSVVCDLGYGPLRLTPQQVLQALLTPSEVSEQLRTVVWQLRLPTAFMAVFCGAALALAGAQMQTILDNPLASPFTLGLSAAASFGAALAIALGVGVIPWLAAYLVPVNAFVMAMLSAFLIHLLSNRRGVNKETIVLFGLALSFVFQALLAVVQFFSSDQAVASVVFWSLGSLTKSTWPKLALVAGSIAMTLPFFIWSAWRLTALRLGETKAKSMGVPVARLRFQVLMMVSFLAACSVASVGTIGFIGLVAPHIARMLVGEDQRFFMPASMLCGALVLSLASLLSRAILPGAIFPIGILTTLIGIPFFIALVMDRKRAAW
ncbi:iron ABC transporter permease [Lampropedia puyangensis]|uniref:Iron ABC transporter permease n=2 Tax=Lampropedia puyangensis TaxID=1330072 RepID=A0A4S8FE09_9BURK|nr:iron ABC transporter permease [Lampropedia puyangensis]